MISDSCTSVQSLTCMSHYFYQVYEVVRLIPPGRVTTYGAIADFLTLGSARMVGYALRNASLLDEPVPAHRVVNRSGDLTGALNFSDPGYMARTLKKEGVHVKNNRVADFKEKFWHPSENLL